MGQVILTSVVLTWSPPQEPNGLIIAYQVTYRIGDSRLVSVNTTDTTFTISPLVQDTNLSTNHTPVLVLVLLEE